MNQLSNNFKASTEHPDSLPNQQKKLFEIIQTCTKRTPGSCFGRVILCVQGEGSENGTKAPT